MRIYLHSDNAEKSPRYLVTVSPAADTAFLRGDEILKDWTLADGTPKQIEVLFSFGYADVPDELGRYMTKRGIAHRTRILRVIRKKLFDRHGKEIDEVFDAAGQPIMLDDAAA
jgi:hypothetical protein